MGLFSLFRQKKPPLPADDGAFVSRTDEDSAAVRNRARRRAKSAANEPADPVLPEKKRARRRLVGAVALVLAAVVGVPMIFDAEPQPLGEDVVIRIPSKTKTTPPAALPVPEKPPAAVLAAESHPDRQTDPVSEPKAIATGKSSPHAEPKPKAEPKPAKALEKIEKPAEKPVEKTPAVPGVLDSQRAEAILEGKNEPVAKEKNNGKLFVQVAALASREKAAELQARLQHAGLKSFTQSVPAEDGEKIRVRLGPFTSTEEAQAQQARLAKLGYAGKLVGD